MCGIAGIIKFRGGVQLSQLKSMTDAIVYRGPDGEGHWINAASTVGFGHRRLSIIDLGEGGHQPMHYQDRYSITFNGEIYNYIELKKELQAKGYAFRSESDTEVLLALYTEYGEELLEHLDGMFSFAIWDEKEQVLFCARDRFGEKPFFYFLDDKQFVFGSEMKEIWAYGIEKDIKKCRIESFVMQGAVKDSNDITSTFYNGINKLDAAHYLKIERNQKVTIKRYWSLDNIKVNYNISFDEAVIKYRELFETSVKVRLRSDVPVGSSLSGGIDSSTIVGLVDQYKKDGQLQKVFSARFKNFHRDEGKFIEEVVMSCKSIESFYTWPSEDNIVDVMENAAYHQEEPFGSSSILAQWKVMELAKEHNITVLLDGQGADEFLAGYMPEYKTYLTQLFFENRRLYEKQYKMYQNHFKETYPLDQYKNTETLRMKAGRIKRRILNQPIEYSALKDRLKFMLTSSGLKELLRYADRNSMAHSREVRLPFLSHKLVEFAFSLPDEFLLQDGWTKYIHRKAFEDVLPKNICWRIDKVGYEPPQQKWLDNQLVFERIKAQQKKYQIPDNLMGKGNYTNSMDWKLFMSSYFD